MDLVDNIKKLHSQITDTEDFYGRIAEHFNMSKPSVRSGWFSRFEFPEKYRVKENVIEFMQNYIRVQNAKKSVIK